MNEILKALAVEYGDYRTHGYKVERVSDRWCLIDPWGSSLFIGNEGGSSIRKESAILEAYRRIAGELEYGDVLAVKLDEVVRAVLEADNIISAQDEVRRIMGITEEVPA